MQNTSHGEFTFEWQGDILQVFPRGNFNEFGIVDLKNTLLETVKATPRQRWVLFERPSNKAGITPDAINELTSMYHELEQLGCILIIMEVPAVFGKAIQAAASKACNIPMQHSMDVEALLKIGQDALDQ